MATTQTTETTFYSDECGIRVTNSRLISGNTTYSMANLSSVAVKQDGINYTILVVGLSGNITDLSVAGGVGTLVCLVAFVISAALRKWNLTITSSSGESSPIRSRNKEYIEKIAQSIQEALIQRG